MHEGINALMTSCYSLLYSILEKYYVGELVDNEMPVYNNEE